MPIAPLQGFSNRQQSAHNNKAGNATTTAGYGIQINPGTRLNRVLVARYTILELQLSGLSHTTQRQTLSTETNKSVVRSSMATFAMSWMMLFLTLAGKILHL